MNEPPSDSAVAFDVVRTSDLSPAMRARVFALFRDSYRAPNDAYLEQSLAKLRYIATANTVETLAGFAVGETRIMDLPRLGEQAVALAGICCVAQRFRRRGLFRELEQRAFRAADPWPGPRVLSCGRVAHPASFRTITWNPTHVPKADRPPTQWQREIGARIAEAYGVTAFDAETFICAGSGRPMDPILDIDVRPEEWRVFGAADRARGDSLLGLCWTPDAPPGW